MRISSTLRSGIVITVLCLVASAQSTPATPGKEAQASEGRGIPPRAAPTDYQAHAAAGTVTVAAEFVGHSVPTPQGIFSSEDYVVVETALFGPADARLQISFEDFALRINEKKTPLPSQPFGMVFRSLKDPEWEPPVPAESKSKGGFNTGGKGGDPPPAPVHMPLPLQRAMEQKVQKASLPEGDRPLPQAGLIFFPYRGKGQGIHSIELTYTGAAGKTTLTLQP